MKETLKYKIKLTNIYITERLYVHLRNKHGYKQGFLGANRKENYCKTRYERSTNTFNVNNMGKPRIITKSFTQFGVESYEGQSIEDRCKKLVETGEPIKDTSPLIYTPKEKGVMPQYDVRADKWDIAQSAMDKVNKDICRLCSRRNRKLYGIEQSI